MWDFVYEANPVRVIFGHGTIGRLGDEVRRIGARRALVLATPQQEDDAHRLAGDIGVEAVGVFAQARMHTPVETTEAAIAVVRALQADAVVAVGGGSTTGLAKAIALRTGLDQIVVPTTYAGSEMTPIVGETQNGRKVTQSSPAILPEVVIYDVDLTLTLPTAMSATSGINAIAHAVEALYAKDRNPAISAFAEQSIAAMARALPRIMKDPADLDARADALYAAWLAGTCLGAVGMSLHHKLCHTLGGTFDLPHSETHTIVLPHAVAYNSEAAPDAMAVVARALGHRSASEGLYGLAQSLGCPMALRDLGMPQSGINAAVELAVQNQYWNPRPLERDGLHSLLINAYHGRMPAA